jgi:glycosyltransferase involved in cell wall biosynthesis
MHITLVNRWYPPHTGYGGVAVYNRYLAHALVDLGHRVTVLAARWSPDVPAIEMDGGVTVHRLLALYSYWPTRLPFAGRYVRPLRQLRYSMQVARKLQELAAVDRPDVIEFAEVEAEGFAYLHTRQRCPVIVRCHTPTYVLRNYYTPQEMSHDTALTAAMEKSCIRRADALTAPSRDMAQTIASSCGLRANQIKVIPNALDTHVFAPGDDRAAVSQAAEVTILHVGRLDRGKGIEVLTRAIPAVLRQVPSARFVFIGDDRPDGQGSTWRARLTQSCAAAGVAGSVLFVGAANQQALCDWYQRADIAVVPSLIYESFSYTCAQALAMGKPVVASRIGGIPETVSDGQTGILIEPGNVDQLTNAIISLISDSALRSRMGLAGRRQAQQFFAADVVAEQMLDVYQRAAAQALTVPRLGYQKVSDRKKHGNTTSDLSNQ